MEIMVPVAVVQVAVMVAAVVDTVEGAVAYLISFEEEDHIRGVLVTVVAV